jgi:hypothetical protein
MDKRLGWFQSLFQQNGGLYQESKHDSPVRNQSPNRPSHLRGSEKTMRIFSQIHGVSDEIRTSYLAPTMKTVAQQGGCSGNTTDSGDVRFTSTSGHLRQTWLRVFFFMILGPFNNLVNRPWPLPAMFFTNHPLIIQLEHSLSYRQHCQVNHTAGNRNSLEKKNVDLLVRKFSAFGATRKFITVFTRACH